MTSGSHQNISEVLFARHKINKIVINKGFPGGSDGKESACNADLGSVPQLGRSPGEGNGYSLQYSCLENPRTEEPGRLQSVVAKSQIQLSDFRYN